MPDGRPKKVQRASRACDFCHKRSVRCKPSREDPERCQNCVDFDIPCTYTRPWKRARTSAAASETATDQDGQPSIGSDIVAQYKDQLQAHTPAGTNGQQPAIEPQPSDRAGEQLGVAWKAFAAASEAAIWALLRAYHRVVYPVFPFFHAETLFHRVCRHDYLVDRGFFASVMAACALAAARGRDGSLTSWGLEGAQLHAVPSETFYNAARDAIPKDFDIATSFDFLRACAILAIVSIQYGKIDAMHEYLGHYFTLSAVHGFSDEARWPAGISRIEREERRRLFWSIYTLDVYSSIVWSGQMRSREGHVSVQYPTEADDEQLETVPSGLVNPACWLHGWNFITDMYRALEHTVDKLRTNRMASERLKSLHDIFAADPFSGQRVLQCVLDMYARLPASFKATPPVTGEQTRDIFGFQAANIQATFQLLRMVLFSVEKNADVDQKCNVAAELLSVFRNVPIAYLKAMGTPLIHHLGGIGTILGSVMEGPLCEASYLRVRSMLLEMADLLEKLESSLFRTAGIGRGLRAQVGRIDNYMALQRAKQTHMPPDSLNTIPASAVPSAEAFPPLSSSVEDFSSAQIQLPPELFGEWPWPFEFTQEFGLPFPGVDPSGLPAQIGQTV